MNTDDLKTALKEGIVVFEYEKKDGTKRLAKGTLNESLLPEKEPDEFELEKEGVDTNVEKNYENLDEYLKKNKLEIVGESEDGKRYMFKRVRKPRAKNDSLVSYYDLEKEEFRSFRKESFIGIISEEKL